MKNKIIFFTSIILLSIIFLPLVFGYVESLGSVKQGECIQLPQTCGNCSYVNISSIVYPDKSIEFLSASMQQQGGSSYNYTFCNTTQLGSYIVNTEGDGVVAPYDFPVTPSGFGDIGSGAGLSLIAVILIMAIIAIVFFILGFKVNNVAAKVGFFAFSIIVFIMAILFIVISSQQNLYGFTGLVTGTETFWVVIKYLIGIGILVLLIIVGLVLYKAWKIKKGYYDYD